MDPDLERPERLVLAGGSKEVDWLADPSTVLVVVQTSQPEAVGHSVSTRKARRTREDGLVASKLTGSIGALPAPRIATL